MKIKTKIIVTFGLVIIAVIAVSIGAYIVLSQGKNNKPQTLEAREKAIKDQIFQIDADYRGKIGELVDEQIGGGCIVQKDVEMTATTTGGKKIEKQWQTVSVEGVCGDLQKQKDDLARERSHKIAQLQIQLDALTARSEQDKQKAMEAIRIFMSQPNLKVKYIATRHPSNFNVGKVTNQDAGGFTMEDVDGWQRKVEVYQQTEFINDLCEVYEYEVDPRNNQIVEIHVRYPEGIPSSPDERTAQCAKFGSFYYPLKTKDQIEQLAFEYLGRAPESTGSMLASSVIQPQYIPSMKGSANPAQNEWRWEDKSYKLPEGLYSDAFAYPVLRIIMSSGGKMIYYFNSTGLFNK